jgi:hypothetical protein
MIVAADAANATRDEMRVTRIFAFHENAVSAKQRRGAFAFDDFTIVEIDLRVDPEIADDPRYGIPGHRDELSVTDLRGRSHR